MYQIGDKLKQSMQLNEITNIGKWKYNRGQYKRLTFFTLEKPRPIYSCLALFGGVR